MQAALEKALETQAEDRRRREDAERRLHALSRGILRHLRAKPQPRVARRLRDRAGDGAVAEIRASDLFDAAWYLETYPDVLDTDLTPEEHFLRHGAADGRDPGPSFSTVAYLRGHPEVAKSGENPLVHHLRTS